MINNLSVYIFHDVCTWIQRPYGYFIPHRDRGHGGSGGGGEQNHVYIINLNSPANDKCVVCRYDSSSL